MAISINWGTKVIFVPKADMTQIQTVPFEVRELNVNTFRLALKDLEDSEEGMAHPDTHRHNTEVSLGGITLARAVEIINDYTVTFEDGQYAVSVVGANSNISDVVNLNQVSIRTANSAGLITTSSGSGLSVEEHDKLIRIPDGTMTGQEHDALLLLVSFVKNKRYLEKVSSAWYLVIRDDGDHTDILRKALKDKNGNNISDIEAGILATELESSV